METEPKSDEHAPILDDLCDPERAINMVRSGFPHKVQGLKLGPRTIPHHVVIFVAANTIHCHYADKHEILTNNDLIWLPPNYPHEIVQGQLPVNLCFLRFEIVAPPRAELEAPPSAARPSEVRALPPITEEPVIIRGASEARPIMEQILQEHRSPLSYHSAKLKGLLLLLFTTILRMDQSAQGQKRSLSLGQRKALASWVDQNLAQWPDTDNMANVVGLSTDYFTRLFRSTYGKAPRAWLMEQRAFRAADLFAESQLSVTEVAHALGYKELFLFSRQFKQVVGLSPRDYRARCRTTNPPRLAVRN